MVNFRASGSNPERRLILGDRLRQPAGQARQCVCQVIVRFDAIRFNPQCRLVFGDRLRQPARNGGAVAREAKGYRAKGRTCRWNA
jgi:hypothetical protein